MPLGRYVCQEELGWSVVKEKVDDEKYYLSQWEDYDALLAAAVFALQNKDFSSSSTLAVYA